MHDELNSVKNPSPYRERSFETESIEKQSEERAKYHKSKHNSIMTDLFDSQFVTRMKCLSCGNQTYSFDNNMDLSIEIPEQQGLNSVTLSDCFEKSIATEQVSDYPCSHCDKKVDIEKDYTIYRFPNILVVHLKRFY